VSSSADSIWGQADRVARSARASGALVPLENRVEWLEDSGFRCAVHVLGDAFRRRTGAASGVATLAPAGNPFLPPDPALFVSELGPTHVAILNKFPVIDRHLLVVTRTFVEQDAPLALEDFAALWRCLPAGDGGASPGLGFYNSGPEAGASQRHRHLQVVPLPLDDAGSGMPFDAAFAAAGPRVGPLPGLPFAHVAVRLEDDRYDDPARLAAESLELYRDALAAVGRDPERPGPYNLLVTRGVLCVIPRRCEHAGPVSVNALGFCGVLLARDQAELRWLHEIGPMGALRQVAG
jgi:sulfate adenylyltransferase (ADP) / ATP adenylyltransferase